MPARQYVLSKYRENLSRKILWGIKYILAVEDKMIVIKRCMDEGEWEDFFAEFETSMIPGEEEEKEGRGVGGREEMRVGRGGGLEEKTGEIKNMDNVLAPLWTNLFWSLTFKVAWGSFSASRRVDRYLSMYSRSPKAIDGQSPFVQKVHDTDDEAEMEKAYKIARMNILAPKLAQKRVFHDIFQFAPKQRKFPWNQPSCRALIYWPHIAQHCANSIVHLAGYF